MRYLGAIINNNLSWKHHIDHVAIKISWTVGLICKLQHFLPRHALLTIYIQIPIHCLFNLWWLDGLGPNIYLGQLFPLSTSVSFWVKPAYLLLKFLYYKLLANLMFEIRHRNAPGNIQDLFRDISDILSFNTRSSVSNNFYTQSTDSQFKWTHFLESKQKYGMKCLCL